LWCTTFTSFLCKNWQRMTETIQVFPAHRQSEESGQALHCVRSLYLMLPDYPSKNKNLTYWNIRWTTAKIFVTEPIFDTSIPHQFSFKCLLW
jgi:hypothetical protein